MDGIEFSDIPKRQRCHLISLQIPSNLTYHGTDTMGKKQEFTLDWIQNLCNIRKIDKRSIHLMFSDGSVKGTVGGSGFFSCDLRYYEENLNLEQIRKDKFVISTTETHGNICYNAESLSMRSSIDFCELNAALLALDNLEYNFNQILRRIKNGNASTLIPKYICMAIDNECVVKWIAGKNNIEDELIQNKVQCIYDWMNKLQKLDINIHLIWIKAHNEENGNELADDLAKLGMLNYYKTLKWTDLKYIPVIEDWNNYAYTAVKKEIKRKVWHNTLEKWHKRLKVIKNGSLQMHLKHWHITYNEIFEYEKRLLTFGEWKQLMTLRLGHGVLNGQNKWIQKDGLCEGKNCTEQETAIHYLLNCELYTADRETFLKDLNDYAYKDIYSLSDMELLRNVLYPLQDKMRDTNYMSIKENKTEIYERRIQSLKILSNFIKNTKRFENIWNYNYNTW